MLPDDCRAAALGPDFQLVRRCRPEGIRSHQQDPLPGFHLLLGDLSNRGGLSHAVNSDHQDHAGLGAQVQGRISHIQHIGEDLTQSLPGLRCLFQVLLPHRLFEPLHRLTGSLHTQVRQDEAFGQLVIEIIVNFGKAGKDTAQGIAQRGPGLCHSGLDFFKKAHTSPPN